MGATLIAAVVLDEVPAPLQWIGTGVVLVGVYVALCARDGVGVAVASTLLFAVIDKHPRFYDPWARWFQARAPFSYI